MRHPRAARGDLMRRLGQPVRDGRFFTAYYITVDEGDQPLPASAAVRHIAGTFFEMD